MRNEPTEMRVEATQNRIRTSPVRIRRSEHTSRLTKRSHRGANGRSPDPQYTGSSACTSVGLPSRVSSFVLYVLTITPGASLSCPLSSLNAQ